MASVVHEPPARGETARSTSAALLDVNALIALLDSDRLHHRRASAWLEDPLASGWDSCAITQNGCARVVSQPSYPGILPAAQVAQRLRDATAAGHHRFIADTPSLLDTRHYDTERSLGHRQVTDEYLLGLALAHQMRLVTFDAHVSLVVVRGVVASDLVVL